MEAREIYFDSRCLDASMVFINPLYVQIDVGRECSFSAGVLSPYSHTGLYLSSSA